MRVVVVCLRHAGRKLTRDEIAAAHMQAGELFIESGTAYLCGGDHPSEWPAHGHLLSPLHDAHVKRLRGDDFVIVGRNLRDASTIHATCPQAWWCRPPCVVNGVKVERSLPTLG